MRIPAVSVNSLHWNPTIYAEMLSQIIGACCDALNGKHPGSPSIFALLRTRNPVAVLFAIIPIVVFSIQRKSWRWITHVFIKVGKLLPPIANRYSTPAVISPCWVFGIGASSDHVNPSGVCRASVARPGLTVFNASSLPGLCIKATAGFVISRAKAIRCYGGRFAAFTKAIVRHFCSSAVNYALGRDSEHFKSSKLESDEGCSFRHGIGSFNVVFSIWRRYMPLPDAKFSTIRLLEAIIKFDLPVHRLKVSVVQWVGWSAQCHSWALLPPNERLYAK